MALALGNWPIKKVSCFGFLGHIFWYILNAPLTTKSISEMVREWAVGSQVSPKTPQ